MAEPQKPALHFTCTHAEALEFIKQHERFWLAHCCCRYDNKKGRCQRTRTDVCLYFRDDYPVPTSNAELREIGRPELEALLKLSQEHHLVNRPFRNERDPTVIDGVCFCCDDCCAYFDPALQGQAVEDKGKLIEQTDLECCIACGACLEVCHFKARSLGGEELQVRREQCFGCGLCVDVCPSQAVEMVAR